MKNYIVKKVEIQDIPEVMIFFKKAYGEDTVFGNENFLNWYFSFNSSDKMMGSCIIAMDENKKVVSHYGGLNNFLKVREEKEPIVWGVNAYTLPEHRGNGINSKIVDLINQEFKINGIIGFTDKTANFYDSIGYNIFGFKRFKRFITIINFDKTEEVISKLGFDVESAKGLIEKVQNVIFEEGGYSNVIKLERDSLKNLKVDFSRTPKTFATTYRDEYFINRRIINHPFINYEVYGVVDDERLIAYIAYRKEKLMPLGIIANRIVDLYGDLDSCELLLKTVIETSKQDSCAYVEFSLFGDIYNDLLNKAGYYQLAEDEVEMIPFCSAPMERRSDNERIGFSSTLANEIVLSMTEENVYFTRVDSDRDRLAKVSQINL